MFLSLCEDDSAYPFRLLALSPFLTAPLFCPHTVLFLSGSNAAERFIANENVREGWRGYEAVENEHWNSNSNRASTASNTPHVVSGHGILCVYVYKIL